MYRGEKPIAGMNHEIYRPITLPSESEQEENDNTTVETAETKTIKEQANYQGHWDDVLYSRLINPQIREQFIKRRLEAAQTMPSPNGNVFQKYETTDQYYFEQISQIDAIIAKAFDQVRYDLSATFNKTPNNMGASRYGEFAAVFTDAGKNGTPLTDRQKNIILAHELGHSVRDYRGPDGVVIRQSLDFSKIPEKSRTYFQTADEIIERMAQLKNYFGMQGAEVFTAEHLRYARQNYVQDTGLDNNMTELFDAITPETEQQFLTVINTFGV